MIRSSADAPATWFLNGLMTTLATREETGGYAVMEHTLTAASNPPPHIQLDEDEAFYVLEGTIELVVDGTTATAEPGTFAFVRRGSTHTFRVVSDVARMLVISSGKSSPGLLEFFTAMGEPAAERALPEPSAPDVDRLTRLAGDSGIVFV